MSASNKCEMCGWPPQNDKKWLREIKYTSSRIIEGGLVKVTKVKNVCKKCYERKKEQQDLEEY